MVKKLTLLITLTTLLASQAFGAALCPSICDNLNKEVVEEASSHCHQEPQKEESSQEMPADCNIMAMLETLSTFHVSSYAVEVPKIEIEKDVLAGSEIELADLVIDQSSGAVGKILEFFIVSPSFSCISL